MKINRKALVLAALALAPILGPGAAIAHPGHVLSGLGAGLIHPFLGLDHLLAMTAVGVWAALQPAHRAWPAPALGHFGLLAACCSIHSIYCAPAVWRAA